MVAQLMNVLQQITPLQYVAWFASLLVFCTFFMKTMIPLRIIAIISNFAFISYGILGYFDGIFSKVLPILILHVLLLPLNIVRLKQMLQLIRRVQEATEVDSIKFLIPYMNREEYNKGEIIFRKNDKANKFYFVQKGNVLLPEYDKTVHQGHIFGEVGLFAPNNVRMGSAVCGTHCVIYSISREKAMEIYYQNPKFGFFLMRMVTRIIAEESREIKRHSIREITEHVEKKSRKKTKKKKTSPKSVKKKTVKKKAVKKTVKKKAVKKTPKKTVKKKGKTSKKSVKKKKR